MSLNKPDIKISVLLLVSTVAIIFCCNLEPVAQDPAYHLFADNRGFLLIPNFFNISSNIVFILVGVLGSCLIIFRWPQSANITLRPNYLVFFLAIVLIGLASGYYHYAPDNASLFIDRIAIAIAFMAFLSIIIAEYITQKYSFTLMLVLIVVGVTSAIYWYATELQGAGDLRGYGLVQFLPLLLIALILVLYPSAHNEKRHIWLILIFYGFAKLFELNDASVYEYTGFVSGHSIKHILAGIAPAILLYSLYHRGYQTNTIR
ncbi:MAG: alkaline phytoceramidase [Gammaproteobacteria bacterium]